MARHAETVNCAESDLVALRQLASDDSDPQLALRATVVLESVGGARVKDVAARCAVLPNFVITWKRRYNENGIQGLRNQPRGNSKGVYGDAFRERLASKLNETPPEGCSRWTGPLLAQALGVDVRVVWRYLRKIHLTAEETAGGAGHPEEQAETQAGPGAGETDSPEQLDLKFVAKYMRKDGSTVVEQEFLVEDAAPDFDDGNLWDRERFRREFATVEENLIRCSSTVASRLAADYMEGVAKKHSQGITPKQGRNRVRPGHFFPQCGNAVWRASVLAGSPAG